MPSVHNGIGTWYYGKNNIHRRVGHCNQCSKIGELESYDTMLYFVVFFIPVLPLGGKRILEQCPSCKRHHVLALSAWGKDKQRAIAEASEMLSANPADPEALQKAVDVSVTYQDEAALEEAAGAVATAPSVPASLLLNVSDAFGYFSRWSEAESACRASMDRERTSLAERKLAVILLKQGRPAEAEPLLESVWREGQSDNLGLVHLLVQGYQSQGMHAQALSVMDRCEQAFPELTKDKEFQKGRRLSTKYQNSGKRIASAFLSESGKVGASEGSWTSRLPKIIFPLLLVAGICAYVSSALWIGTHRKVYFVNGTNRAYAVSVNGVEHKLSPGKNGPIPVTEGDVEVKVLDPRFPPDPIVCRVATSFMSRPFKSKTFVINPDQSAILVWEEATYVPKGKPHPEERVELRMAKPLYEFDHINYEFVDFPQTLTLKENERAVRTKVDIARGLSPIVRLQLALKNLSPAEQITYARRRLAFEPDDVYTLGWLISQLTPRQALDFLRQGLDQRPPNVEWHRMYQALMEINHPETDLKPEYAKLVKETNRSADAVYLLGRISDGAEADKLLQEAANAISPSSRAMASIGYRNLAAGRFKEAVASYAKASPLVAPESQENMRYLAALEAAGDYAKLKNRLQQLEQVPGLLLFARTGLIRILAAEGDKKGSQQAIDDLRKQNASDPQFLSRLPHLEAARACGAGDIPGYLRSLSPTDRTSLFLPLLLDGNLKKAANSIQKKANLYDATERALLYLFATKKKDRALADEQWKLLCEEMTHGDREHRQLAKILSGAIPARAAELQELTIDPDDKRVYLLLVAQRFPELGKEIMPFARKLDFQHDETSLALKSLRGG